MHPAGQSPQPMRTTTSQPALASVTWYQVAWPIRFGSRDSIPAKRSSCPGTSCAASSAVTGAVVPTGSLEHAASIRISPMMMMAAERPDGRLILPGRGASPGGPPTAAQKLEGGRMAALGNLPTRRGGGGRGCRQLPRRPRRPLTTRMISRTPTAPSVAMRMLSTLIASTEPIFSTSAATYPPTNAPTMPRTIIITRPSLLPTILLARKPATAPTTIQAIQLIRSVPFEWATAERPTRLRRTFRTVRRDSKARGQYGLGGGSPAAEHAERPQDHQLKDAPTGEGDDRCKVED